MADLLKDSSSEHTSDEESQEEVKVEDALIPQKDPAEKVFDDNVENVNNFLKKVREFEEITNRQITDMWRIKDMAF